MMFKQIVPSGALRPHVKTFWFFDSEEDVTREEVLLPTGFLKIALNLGRAEWKSKHGDKFLVDPPLQLRGQQKRPSVTKMIGRDIILGVDFHPYTACLFLTDKANNFTNSVLNLSDVVERDTLLLFDHLLSVNHLTSRIDMLEIFLLEKLNKHKINKEKIDLLKDMISTLVQSIGNNSPVKQLTIETGFSERYIQQLFEEYIGLSPKTLQKIYRFHESLRQLNKSQSSLTSIAYHCGYSDQAHFARDFKSFTGITPSTYKPDNFPSSTGFL